MRHSWGVITGLAGLVIAGCVSPEEQRAADQQRCAGYGFQPGTDAFAQCMMNTDAQRQANQQAERDRQTALRIKANPSLPYCAPGMPGVRLNGMTATWYGPNCTPH